jgi:hypothetical protein
MVAAGGALWVACTSDDVVLGLDRTTLRRTARVRVAGSPDSLTTGAHGQVLVALQKGPALAVIDTGSSTVLRRVAFGRQDQLHDRANIDVAYAARRAWVSSYLEGGVYRSR